MRSSSNQSKFGLIFCASLPLACIVLFVCKSSDALVTTRDTCTWPEGWPRELAEVSLSCQTIEFMSATQENVFEIFVRDREQFERLWPALVSTKTPRAPIRLKAMGVFEWNGLMTNGQPTVRIYAPDYGGLACLPLPDGANQNTTELVKQGLCLRPTPPWPSELVGLNGELPEYVVVSRESDTMKWVQGDLNAGLSTGRLYRARIELELVVDGQVIDLNRIQFPTDTPIIDWRFPSVPRTN